MRIGLDARFLTHPQRGGFKTYTTNLIRALGEVDRENEYVVYVDRAVARDARWPNHPTFTYKTVPGTLPGVGMPVREQVLLRRHAAADALDLLHFLCNTATIGLRMKTVVTLHDVIQVTSVDPLVRRSVGTRWPGWHAVYSAWTIRRVAPAADHLITVSHYEKDQISRALEIPPARISVTHLAPQSDFVPVDDQHAAQRRHHLRQVHGVPVPYLLGVGYERRKNLEFLIDVFATLAAEFPDLRLVVIAAHAGRRRQLQGHARARGLGDRAVFLGGLPAPELAELYGLAEAFVYPSVREGFGLPPLEAMACGTPTIALRASSVSEVVGEGAILMDGLDVGAWAGAVRTVLRDRELRADLVRLGLARAAAFSWTRCAKQTIDVYRRVISPAGPS